MNAKDLLAAKYSHVTQRLASKVASDIHQSLDAEVVRQLADAWASDVNLSGEAWSLAGYLAAWRKRAIATSTGLTVAGFTCLGLTSFADNPIHRLITANGAIGCWALAKQQRRTVDETEPVLGTLSRIQAAQSAMTLTQLWKKQPTINQQAVIVEDAPPTLPYSPELFDWNDFRSNPDLFPHLMILGKTGSGKSMLAEWLLSQLGGKITAVTPHRSPNDWKGIKVVGGGRDFSAIAEYFSELTGEMQRRYQLYDIGRTDFDPWNIAIDELPAIMAAPECGDVPSQLKELIRESRKVKIRLLLLTQGAEVKALKIEGEGSLRDSLTFVRLGNFAVDHARKTLKDDALLEWLKPQKRPCLVDDQPATVPNLQ